MKLVLACAAAVLLVACAGGPPPAPEAPPAPGEGPTPEPGREAAIPPHETYLRNPTSVTADEVRVILPLEYADRIEVRGLTSGWRETEGGRTWEGTGDCALSLLSLTVRARVLSVSLEPAAGSPQTILQAIGNVTLAHSVRGVGTLLEGRRFLQITNQRQLAE